MVDRERVRVLLQLLEGLADHSLSMVQWAWLLCEASPAYRERPPPPPEVFRDHGHRLEVYAQRRALGQEIFHPADWPRYDGSYDRGCDDD